MPKKPKDVYDAFKLVEDVITYNLAQIRAFEVKFDKKCNASLFREKVWREPPIKCYLRYLKLLKKYAGDIAFEIPGSSKTYNLEAEEVRMKNKEKELKRVRDFQEYQREMYELTTAIKTDMTSTLADLKRKRNHIQRELRRKVARRRPAEATPAA